MANKWELKYKRKCLKEQTAARDVWQGYRGKSHVTHSEVCRHWEGSTISLQCEVETGNIHQTGSLQPLLKKPLFYLHFASTGRLSPAVLVYQAVCKSISISLPLSSVLCQSLSYDCTGNPCGLAPVGASSAPALPVAGSALNTGEEISLSRSVQQEWSLGLAGCAKAPRTKVLGWM